MTLLANAKSGGIVPLTPCGCVTGKKSYDTKGPQHWTLTIDYREFANNIISLKPSNHAGGLGRISLCESVPYGTIPAEAVTHRLFLLDWPRFPERVYDAATS
jgi:hypothetical protein